MEILGIKIDNLEREEILSKIESFLDEPKFHQIATINPEFVLEAQKNEQFKKILNECDLNVADGYGLNLAFWLRGKKLKSRFPGADLLPEILRIAENRGLVVFLACRKDGLSSFSEIERAILENYPKLKLEGKNIDINDKHLELYAKYQIMICNFGSPEQEAFIQKQKNDTMRLAIGVGGALDFLSGRIQRAPNFWRKIGLEWLWRFIQEPGYRWKRIWRAVVVFPIKLIF